MFLDDSLLYCFNEENMSSKERNSLDDSKFGIPSLRKYPLNDKDHVLSAIRMFNYVDKEHEKELAHNIFSAMKEYNISQDSISNKNRLSNYIDNTNEGNELFEFSGTIIS